MRRRITRWNSLKFKMTNQYLESIKWRMIERAENVDEVYKLQDLINSFKK